MQDTWMHKARHLAAEYNGGGIRDSLMNSFSNVGIGDVMKRRRWDTSKDAVSGKLQTSWRRLKHRGSNILLYQYCDCLQSSHLDETIGNRRMHAQNDFETGKKVAVKVSESNSTDRAKFL
jgi:hypothetical protein